MIAIQLTLWEVIDALARQIPLTKEKVERILSRTLNERVEPGNDSYRFFLGDYLGLKGNVMISKIDFGIRGDGAGPGFLVLHLEGVRIRVAEVRRHYNTLEITAAPRGHSLEEATVFSTMQSWGELSFGFKERNPECLAYLVLKPRVS